MSTRQSCIRSKQLNAAKRVLEEAREFVVGIGRDRQASVVTETYRAKQIASQSKLGLLCTVCINRESVLYSWFLIFTILITLEYQHRKKIVKTWLLSDVVIEKD